MSSVGCQAVGQQAEDRFTAGLRSAGLKLTAQREAICLALAEMAGRHHPTVHEVFELARTHHAAVSLATVYNTLTVLKDRGLLYELGPDLDGAVHYELDTATHVNVVCVRCRQIVDIHEAPHHGLEEAVAQQSGFALLGGQVLYYGFCPACRGAGESERAN